MSNRNGSTPHIVRIRNKEELDKMISKGGYRVVMKDVWKGDDNYYLREYTQRCPKGCCYDNVFELSSVEEEISELKEQMRDLANRLKEARVAQSS